MNEQVDAKPLDVWVLLLLLGMTIHRKHAETTFRKKIARLACCSVVLCVLMFCCLFACALLSVDVQWCVQRGAAQARRPGDTRSDRNVITRVCCLISVLCFFLAAIDVNLVCCVCRMFPELLKLTEGFVRAGSFNRSDVCVPLSSLFVSRCSCVMCRCLFVCSYRAKGDTIVRRGGCVLYKLMFAAYADAYNRQETINTLIGHVGSGVVSPCFPLCHL